MVELETPGPGDMKTIKRLLECHFAFTGSSRAKAVLDDLANRCPKFVKVMPTEYKNILKKLAPPTTGPEAEDSEG